MRSPLKKASACRARPGSAKMVTAPLVALSAVFLMAAAGAEDAMDLAIPTKIGGEVYLVIKGYSFDMNGEKLEQMRSGSPCACRLQCSTMKSCFIAVYDSKQSVCTFSLTIRPPKSAEGSHFFLRSPFKLAADGLYYHFMPGFVSYHNSVRQCAALGSRIGVARTSLALEIMRALHIENGETSAWIGLFQTQMKSDLHWEVDGSLLNTSFLTSDDQTLAKVPGDTAYFFSSGALQYSTAPSTDVYGVICQANYFGAFW